MSVVKLEFPEPYVAVIVIDRPPVNAFDANTRRELIETMDGLQDRDDVRAIVVTATGNVFCAGADIKEKAKLNVEGANMHAANRLTTDLFRAFLDSRKPIVAAAGGHAMGAGVVLLSVCDIVLAAEGTVFAMPEVDVGQGGGASFLQRIIPISLMRKMVLTGQRIPAEEFYRLGVFDRVLPKEELLPAAIEIAAMIAAKSPLAVRTIRDSLRAVEELPLGEGWRIEQSYLNLLSASDDGKEARRAFLEKRPAKF